MDRCLILLIIILLPRCPELLLLQQSGCHRLGPPLVLCSSHLSLTVVSRFSILHGIVVMHYGTPLLCLVHAKQASDKCIVEGDMDYKMYKALPCWVNS